MKTLRDPARAAAALAAGGSVFVALIAAALILSGLRAPIALVSLFGAAALAAAVAAAASRMIWRRAFTPLLRLIDDLRQADPDRLPERLGASSVEPRFTEIAELQTSLAALLVGLARRHRSTTEARRRADLLLNALDEPVLAVDSRGVLTMGNDAAASFFGVERAALEGAPVESVVTQAALLAALRAGLDGRWKTKRVELAAQRGPRVVEVSVAPIPSDDGEDHGAAMSVRDITELALAARMKTQFVANASHELRTPLAAIRGAMDTVRTASQEDPASVPRFLDMIASHLRRLEEMTTDLLDLSRLEGANQQPRIEPLRIDELTSSLNAMFETVCERRSVNIAFDIDPRLEGARTDPRMLHLALRNLIDNAAKFCYENTTVHVEGRLLPPAPASKDGEPSPRRARFEVRDRGVGIPLNQQQRVFERFYQVDPSRLGAPGAERRGTGLGLAIVKHAAGALGGTVGLESVYGEGSTLWLESPVTLAGDAPDAARPTEASGSTPAPLPSG